MTAPPLPAPVERFIGAHVDSIAQLEILVLLCEDATGRMTAETIARRLGLDATWAAAELRGLAARGVIAESGDAEPAYELLPPEEAAGRDARQVVQTYRERRLSVVEVILQKPSKNIRVFAEAFRLRKD
jgi:hypothetical protein